MVECTTCHGQFPKNHTYPFRRARSGYEKYEKKVAAVAHRCKDCHERRVRNETRSLVYCLESPADMIGRTGGGPGK